jgi:hypothetical protein
MGSKVLDGMANICELLINVVISNERSRADTLDQKKGKGTGRSVIASDLTDITVPGEKAEPNPSGHFDETGQARMSPSGRLCLPLGKHAARFVPMDMRVEEVRGSQCPAVMAGIAVRCRDAKAC